MPARELAKRWIWALHGHASERMKVYRYKVKEVEFRMDVWKDLKCHRTVKVWNRFFREIV